MTQSFANLNLFQKMAALQDAYRLAEGIANGDKDHNGVKDGAQGLALLSDLRAQVDKHDAVAALASLEALIALFGADVADIAARFGFVERKASPARRG